MLRGALRYREQLLEETADLSPSVNEVDLQDPLPRVAHAIGISHRDVVVGVDVVLQ